MILELFNRKKKSANVYEDATSLNESYSMPLDDKEAQFERDLASLRLKYQMGKIPKLTQTERNILEFCASRDMKEFLREEFEKHPIVLDEDGGLVGGNPFINERRNQYILPDERIKNAPTQVIDYEETKNNLGIY